MSTETTFIGTGYRGGGYENVISFAGYIARYGRKKKSRYAGQQEDTFVPLSACDVINLADRRG